MRKKSTFFLSILVISLLPWATSLAITEHETSSDFSANYDGYIDITVEETWALLNDTSNGIQIPIDVRTDGEWESERIDTPYPEDPRLYCLSDLQNENGLQEFISLNNGSEVILSCKAGSRSVSAANILVNSEFNGTIYNMVGGITAWKGAGLPTKLGNDQPYQPDEPSGPSAGITEYSYWFSTSTIDPDDDSVKYGWDWNGDDIVDDWTNYYPSATLVNISHSWTAAGTYDVKVIAEDNVGDQSDFSSALTLTVTVVVNSPPDMPIIQGPPSGTAGKEYDYTFSAVDPDGDDVYFKVKWTEGCPGYDWLGPYPSGEEVILSHMWEEKGTFIIQAKAKDIYNATSDWATLEVTMPKSYGLSIGVASTSLSDAELEISDIRGGLGAVIVDVKNIGDAVAEDIVVIISVKGGLLNKIDVYHECRGCSGCGSTLAPDAIKTESTAEAGLIFGFGQVEIFVSTSASNADEVTQTLDGLVLGPFVMI